MAAAASAHPAPATSDDALKAHLAPMRQQLVDRVFRAAGVLALLYLPVVVWRGHDVGWHLQLQLHAALIAVTFGLVAARSRLSTRVKSAILVTVFLLLGTAGVFTLGMVGTGYWWCLQGAVMMATLFSMRAGIVTALASASMLSLSGVGFVSGALAPPFDLNAHLGNASAWSAFLVVVVFAPLALLLALGSYQSMVERLVAQVDDQRRRLEAQVGHDTLTGLPLMRLAADRVDVAIRHARRVGCKVALLFVDLDGFKAINDGHGHAAGDHVLQEVAARLRGCVREEDTVARVGGDEFVVVAGDLTGAAGAERLARDIHAALAAPVTWQRAALQASASVGIALFPDDADDGEALRRAADAAMYGAKHAGRSRHAFATAAGHG